MSEPTTEQGSTETTPDAATEAAEVLPAHGRPYDEEANRVQDDEADDTERDPA